MFSYQCPSPGGIPELNISLKLKRKKRVRKKKKEKGLHNLYTWLVYEADDALLKMLVKVKWAGATHLYIFFLFVCLFKDVFHWFETEREVRFPSLTDSPSVHSSRGWAEPKPRARSFSLVSQVGVLAASWIVSGAIGTWTSIHVGCCIVGRGLTWCTSKWASVYPLKGCPMLPRGSG